MAVVSLSAAFSLLERSVDDDTVIDGGTLSRGGREGAVEVQGRAEGVDGIAG